MVVQGQASAAAASVAIPAHQPGDLIFVFARRASNSSATIPSPGGTVPTWLTAQSLGANTLALTTVYAVATASDHTTGTFTNASHVCVLVLRPDSGKALAYGGSSTINANAVTTLIYPALTLQKTDGTSWCVRCGTKSVASTPVGTAPTNYTNQSIQPAGASALMSVHTRAGLTANEVASSNVTGATSGASRAHTVEVLEVVPAALTLDLNDSVAVVDSIGTAQGHVMALADSAPLVDDGVFSCAYTLSFADKISFGGLFPDDVLYPSGDWPSGGDELYIGEVVPVFLNIDDAVGLSDSLLTDVVMRLDLADTVALVDALVQVSDLVLDLNDTAGLLDGLSLEVPGEVTLALVDVVALADALTFVAAYGELLVDAVPLADALTFAQGNVLSLADTVPLADSMEVAVPIIISLSDSVGLADSGPTTDIQRQWLIPIPEEPETLAPVAEQTLVLTPAAEGLRELSVVGGTLPSATPQPENVLDITPFVEGEH